jgi:hypothetical protein
VTPADESPVRVGPLMDQIEADVRSRIRLLLIERGGVIAYEDREVFERVLAQLRRAVDGRNLDVLLLPNLLSDEAEWALEPDLRFSSHRPIAGRVVLFAKQRLLLPLVRWLFEYSQANFKRQHQLNRILLSCVEELAIENARLRQDLTALSNKLSP